MKSFYICQTGNGDPPSKKPPTEVPTRRNTDVPQDEDTEGAE